MQDTIGQEQRFYHHVRAELGKDRLIFPTSMEVSLRVKRLVDDPTTSLRDLEAAVRLEPVLAAKVLRMANSVMLNPRGAAVTSIREAIARIGVATVRCFAFAVALEQLQVCSRSRVIQRLSRDLWRYSVDVASWAYGLAQHLRVPTPDAAMFAGMLVVIGDFFVLSRASGFPALERDVEALRRTVADLREPARREVLRSLEVPDVILQAALECEGEEVGWPPSTLSEVVILGRSLATTPDPFRACEDRLRRVAFSGRAAGEDALAYLSASALPGKNSVASALSSFCG